jgi:replication factor C small subunit
MDLMKNKTYCNVKRFQSRCTVFKFTRISEEEIIGYLEEICKKEKLKYTKDGLKTLYFYSEGDMLHSINML